MRPPGAISRNLAALRLLESHERALAPAFAERPAKARMQAAGVRGGLRAGVFDLDRHGERLLGEPVFDHEREGERVDGARALVVAQHEPGEIRAGGLDGEGLEAREAVQAERVMPSADPCAVARPADDRIEDRADVRPDRRIARPQEVASFDAPASRLRAGEGDGRARFAFDEFDGAHRTIPSIAAAEISASLTPGAQAISGLPLVSPSPLKKSLT